MRERIIFGGLLCIIALVLCARLWPLRLLYLDASVRTQTEQALRTVTEREGWLLSDMDVRRVSKDSVRLLHHQHLRGPDPVACFDLSLTDSSLMPCEK